ncbi:serpin-Z1-like [Lolium rigidum]|uniref:serpin-Z1-like n=1 Tax=Lolium rigidum TaxID=89674 RepID=UPI001F5DB824|nr:serpin-Z1-like [Lolium rigidum]
METEIAEAGSDEVAFAMRALHHLMRADACRPGAGASNLAISPLSIHAALVLLGAGARGATLDEIVAVLGPAGGHAHALLASRVALRVLADADGENGGPKLRFANGVWVDDAAARLKADYTGVVAEHYRAQARQASFSTMPDVSRNSINQWFEAATAGLIKDFLPSGSVSAATRCILANALYFKGVWDTKFDAQLTQPGTFHLPANREVLVPFMSSRLSQYIACCPDWKVLKLLYACGGIDESRRRQFAMYIYLPNQRNGLQSMVQKLAASPDLLNQVSMDIWANKVPVGDFRVPKFTISYKAEATGLLQGLGLRLPFDHQAADFSEMLESTDTADHRGFVVSNVYHQSFVEVNEQGTEAAAATMFGCYGAGCSSVVRTPVPVVDFVADHPFMYLIKEELTGVVVFAGQVVNPSL